MVNQPVGGKLLQLRFVKTIRKFLQQCLCGLREMGNCGIKIAGTAG
jgi:hypothetical protein